MVPIKIGIIGVGNCASSLLQGIAYYRGKDDGDAVGILNWSINGYTPYDMAVVSAFDIDQTPMSSISSLSEMSHTLAATFRKESDCSIRRAVKLLPELSV